MMAADSLHVAVHLIVPSGMSFRLLLPYRRACSASATSGAAVQRAGVLPEYGRSAAIGAFAGALAASSAAPPGRRCLERQRGAKAEGKTKGYGTQRGTMPALLSMMVGGFAIGTTEYASVGVLPQIADDCGVNLVRAGLVVSGYALGVSFGSPILAALTGNLSRKALILAVMALFVLANAAAASSASYEVLIVARIVSALPHGIFFGVGAAIAASLVGADRRASAVAIVFGGLTIAVAAGVPVATVIGQRLGWPMSYWFVAAIGVVSLLAMAATLPRKIDIAPAGSLIEQVKVLGSGRLLIAFGMNFCAWGGTFVASAYLPSILADITGFDPNGVAWILALYGVSVIVGNFLGRRVFDKKVVPALALMLGAQAAVLLIFTFTAPSTLGSILTLGALMFCNVPGLALYVVQLVQRHRPGNVDIASTINVSAANAGIALGAVIGGLVADSRLGLGATPWVGVVMVGIGLLLTVWSGWLDQRETGAGSVLSNAVREH
ncbi:MFS transporter [Lonsdalea populi]|uniref:MFS transporter n=1 Tax=Lonsdalea populi TaxID=1172565 RepID=UPI001C6567C9|nr:MFS transporter [Lonsdalea populi]